jgi:hypothetical protein
VPVHWPATVLIAQKDVTQPARDLIGNLPQGELFAGTFRAFNSEFVAVEIP